MMAIMKLMILTFSSITVIFVHGFAVSSLKSSQLRKRMISMSVSEEIDNAFVKMIARCTGVGIIALSLSDLSFLQEPFSMVSVVQPAYADVRAQQKRTYFRFSPKFITGSAYYASNLKTAIDKDDWSVVGKFFDEYVTKYNPNDKTQVDQTDTYVNNYLFRPMKLLSGSFAERGSSPKQKALNDLEVAFESAMKELEGCVKDMPGEGFFSATVKMPTGEQRTKQGLDAWNKGKVALNSFVEVLNDGLMLELNKLKPI